MTGTRDRRQFPRYSAVDLMADIDGEIFTVTDISLGGLRLAGAVGDDHKTLTFNLRPVADDDAGALKAVKANGEVVGHYDDGTAIKFQSASMPLMKIVVRQASLELGVEPYFLK